MGKRMKRVFGTVVATIGLLLTSLAAAPAAHADGIYDQGGDFAGISHYGSIRYGYVYIDSAVEIYYNNSYDVTKIRGRGEIEKGGDVARVQIDKVVLGDSGRAVTQTTIPVSSGNTGQEAVKYTSWIGVRDGTCSKYRVRVYYSIRWADGSLSKLNRLAKFTDDRFCRR